MNKPTIFSLASLALFPIISTANAGEMVISPNTSVTDSGRSLKSAIHSLTNPALHESAIPQTNMRGIFINHQTPDLVSVGGAPTPVGGDVNIIALQLEYALSDRLSLVATKDGYIDFKPDNTLAEATGFADIAAGLKYAFIYDEVNDFAASTSLQLELPTGNTDVFQGRGDGAALLTFSAVKLLCNWQFSGATGIHVPFDSDANSTTGFASAHVSYQLTERFTPIAEVNMYHTFSAGSTGLPTDFEEGSFFNFGSPNAEVNETAITAALGARYMVSESLSLGAAYEIPLTDEEENFMDSRITLDFVYKF
jgi:hypothetical protein